jgi:putative ABC transport system permease protein
MSLPCRVWISTSPVSGSRSWGRRVTSVASEFTVVLGAAAVACILAGALSQYVVVLTVTLGYADSILTPRALPSLNVTAVAALLAVAFAVSLSLAILLGGLTIHGARTATLREYP